MKKTIKFLKIAIIVLGISFLFVLCGIQIPSLFTTGTRMVSEGFEHINLFGNYFRISGFAEDANYAFLFFYTMLLMLFLEKKSLVNCFIGIICFFGLAYSFSKTQILMIIPSFFIYIIIFKFKINIMTRKIIIFAIILLIFVSPFVMLKLHFLDSLATLDTRYTLWSNALEMLKSNNYLPSGVGGFRYYNFFNYFHWMVQSHSTYVEVLCELGILPFFILIYIFVEETYRCEGIPFLILINYLCFSITSETLYLQFFIFITYILYISNRNRTARRIEKQ